MRGGDPFFKGGEKVLNSQVTTWFMSEEERLAYIAKHPIKTMDKPKAVIISNRQVKNKQPTLMDGVDKEKLYELFSMGKPIERIAEELGVSSGTLTKYITKQRSLDPEKWPYRAKKKG